DRKSESSKTSEETKPESEFNSEMLSEGFKETESNYQDDSLIGHSGKDLVNNESSLVGSGSEKSKDEGHPLIGNSSKNLAKKVSENENIPLGTAKNYISELKKELKSKEPKVVSEKEKKKGKNESKSKTLQSKDKVKEFQKKYSKMSSTAKKAEVNRLIGKLIQVRKNREKLDAQVTAFIKEDSLIVEKLFAVGEKKRVQGLSV
ncbi:chromosome partitioning protein ParB, partial [Leptospira noguchii]